MSVLTALVVFGSAALADTTPYPLPTTLPSVTIGTAALISPSQANTFYGSSTTSTDGLSKITGEATPTPPEIIELARALKNNVDLIYAYVHDNIDTDFMYGLQKGPLGALIDKSGTPFDQAALMVALLRQAGYTASYQVGTLSLGGSDFTAWTNISDSNAACRLLANGGFPGSVNSQTTMACSTATGGAISNVTMAHVWVAVTIPGSACTNNICLFDPSSKPYIWRSGINLASALGLTPSNPLVQAAGSGSGMTTGTLTDGSTNVPYIQSLNYSNLNSALAGYSSNLLSYLSSHYGGSSNPPWPELVDVIGGGTIAPDQPPSGGWRQSTLTGYTATTTWTGNVPDQYRTTLEVKGQLWIYTACTSQFLGHYATMFDEPDSNTPPFFVDQIYGRALMIEGAPNAPTSGVVTLTLDGVVLFSYSIPACVVQGGVNVNLRTAAAYVTFVANHPYAASSDGTPTANGTYMDATVVKPVGLITAATIAHGWGSTAQALFDKWSGEKAVNTPMANVNGSCPGGGIDLYCGSTYTGGQGDFDRERMVASWLAQYTQAAKMQAQMGSSIAQLHHVLGLAYGDDSLSPVFPYGVLGTNPPVYFIGVDNYNRLDFDSALSWTAKAGNTATRRASLRAFGASASTLEGVVSSQIGGMPDTGSVATRMEWGNAPPGMTGSWDPTNTYEDPNQPGPRKFVTYTSSTVSAANDLSLVDGWTVSQHPAGGETTPVTNNTPVIASSEAANWVAALASEAANYTAAGFNVVTSQEAFLGPGQRGGVYTADTIGDPPVRSDTPTT
jgi:hypothetical protein